MSLVEQLKDVAETRTRPDGSSYSALMFHEELKLVTTTQCSHRDIQIRALKNGIIPERYARNQTTLTNEEQLRLLKSHVAIIGLGGLGGTVTEILARIGIGKLTLVDGDIFEDSNLNRQILSSTETLGQHKAEVARARVNTLNPAVETITQVDFFKAENGNEILQNVDIAVDCLDTITDRFTLETACRNNSIPLVSAAIGGTSGQATVILPEDKGLKRIYGAKKSYPKKGIEATLGTLPYTAIAMAAIECAEIVSLALGRPAHLRNKLVLTDFTYHSMDTLTFD